MRDSVYFNKNINNSMLIEWELDGIVFIIVDENFNRLAKKYIPNTVLPILLKQLKHDLSRVAFLYEQQFADKNGINRSVYFNKEKMVDFVKGIEQIAEGNARKL